MGRAIRQPLSYPRNRHISNGAHVDSLHAGMLLSRRKPQETARAAGDPAGEATMLISRRTVTLALLAALAAAPLRAAQPDWPNTLTIATGSPGGTYFAYGEALGKLLSTTLGIRVITQPTDGPSENIALLEEGKADLGFVTLGVAAQAWDGTAPWTEGVEMRDFRAVFPMYDTPFHFIVRKASPAQKLGDLAGLRSGVGPEGGTGATYAPVLLETLGIEGQFATGNWDELEAKLEAGELDALAVAAGAPFPAVSALEARGDARYLPVTPEQVLTLRFAFPELGASTIPAGTYASLMYGYDTVGLYNFAVARPELPPTLVEAIAKTVFDNNDVLVEAHPAAASTIPSNFTRNTFLPYHPGAAQYYGATATSGVMLSD